MYRVALAVPVALACVLGCEGPGRLQPANIPPVLVNARPADNYHSADTVAANELAALFEGAALPRPAGRPQNFLCVSGGGKFALFDVGALVAWTETGTRPVFDVATGVSSGVPVALLAFLGPKYDKVMTDSFLAMRKSDLFAWAPFRAVLPGRGVMTTEPLAQHLDRLLTDDMLADLRAAHAEGRRLFVGTANVDTHRLVVWDVGAVASSCRPDANHLVRKIVRAACSFPGVTTPVEFDVTVDGVRYTERHGDAGYLSQTFLCTPGPVPPGSTVWLLAAGKSHREPLPIPGRARVFSATAATVSAMLYALFRADAVKLHTFAIATRGRFQMLTVPEDMPVDPDALAFDPGENRRLFTAGYDAVKANRWRSLPPDTMQGEVSPPRAGFDFTTIK